MAEDHRPSYGTCGPIVTLSCFIRTLISESFQHESERIVVAMKPFPGLAWSCVLCRPWQALSPAKKVKTNCVGLSCCKWCNLFHESFEEGPVFLPCMLSVVISDHAFIYFVYFAYLGYIWGITFPIIFRYKPAHLDLMDIL